MLSKLIPSSLFVRFILIIILPTIFAQLIATYMFYNRHWHSVSKNMAYSLYNDIRVVYDLENKNIPTDIVKQIQNKLNLKSNVYINSEQHKKIVDYYPTEAELLFKLLKNDFAVPVVIKFIDDKDSIQITIFVKDKIIDFITNSKRINNSSTYIFILWMTGTSIIFLLLSIIFTRNQIRPIIKLARAVDKFGKGHNNIQLKVEGAKEVRKASLAFLKMCERIERQMSHRTEMLAGVSHDLRTPLTRMKLQVSISKDLEVKHMLDDIKDMEYMINSYLDFARGDNKETPKMVYFQKFLLGILKSYTEQNYVIKNCPNRKIFLKINSIKRCFQNLLDNAFKYASRVIINSYVFHNDLIVEIHDNGPNIPVEKREEVFKPFIRLEESRNKDTGGIGLGLAITRDIISNHGGNIYLESSELLEGLKVVIILPLS